MRNTQGVNSYTGSVFLTKTLTDSGGEKRRVQCESLASIAVRLAVPVWQLRRLAERGGIDGALNVRGAVFVPVPVRVLRPWDGPIWSERLVNSSSAGSGSSELGSVRCGAPENRASVEKGGVR